MKIKEIMGFLATTALLVACQSQNQFRKSKKFATIINLSVCRYKSLAIPDSGLGKSNFKEQNWSII
jgi:hypothetical protein